MNVRGQRRRAELRSASAALLAEQGFDALTHRALSARSGVPLGSTTHYFPSVDDLVLAAAEELAEAQLGPARALVAGLPRRRASAATAARVVVRVVLGDDPSRAELTTTAERYVQAGRVPALRPVVVAWNAEVRGLVVTALDRCGRPVAPARARLLVAAVDGLVLTALAEGADDPLGAVVRPLARLLADPATA